MNTELFSPCNGHILVEYIQPTPSTSGLIMPTPYHQAIIRGTDSWDKRQCPEDICTNPLLGQYALVQAGSANLLPGIAITMDDKVTYHLIKFELILAVYETEEDE